MKHILTKNILDLDYYKIAYESKLEKQLAKLPKIIKFCKNVLYQIKERITFDKNGVCSACNWFEEKKR